VKEQHHLWGWLRATLTSGLLVLTPVVVSLWLLTKMLFFLDSILDVPMQWLLVKVGYIPNPEHHLYGPGLLALIILLLLAGWLTRLYIGRRLFAAANAWFETLPVISTIYSTIRPLSRAVFGGQEKFFREVVWTPLHGGRSIGFIVGEATLHDDLITSPMVAVYVPFAPPTTGMLLYYEREKLLSANMTVEEGMKMLFSFGVAQSENDEIPGHVDLYKRKPGTT